MNQSGMSEESMQRLDAHIPELAGMAFRLAYLQALTTSGKVVEGRQGQLIETTAAVGARVIRSIAMPTQVRVGEKRLQARPA